jgi:triacylglycerol lipase
MSRIKPSPKNMESLADKKAREFSFKSKLTGPIAELSLLQRALLFAEVSMISYLSLEECNIAAGKLGFIDGKFFNSNNAQAYWFQSEFDSVVVFRGTEAREWEDIQADANALAAMAETVGKVHRGFKSECDEIWPYLEKELEPNTLPLWFCGHSLGGAMANICAGRCMLSYLKSEPEQLYTYGSPRIGCRKYVNHVKLKHYRWVNNNDIVTRVPPPWLSYRHNGHEMYLNRYGHLKELSGWRRMSDRLQGFLHGLMQFRIDQFTDHSAINYIDAIFELVRSERPAAVAGKMATAKVAMAAAPAKETPVKETPVKKTVTAETPAAKLPADSVSAAVSGDTSSSV